MPESEPDRVSARRGELRAWFDAHINDQTDECMIWPFSVTSAGYGMITYEGRRRSVHEVACEVHHGPRPPGHVASHGPCHNPRCWNPRHLSWQTHKQDAADRVRDGTRLAPPRTADKLSLEKAREIRRRWRGRLTIQMLADEYGVTPGCIRDVLDHKTWRETDE